jgi:ketosteroid isomerase-like protein
MKTLMKVVLVLAGCVSLDPVLAQPPRVAPEGSSVVDTIKQIERDWANAIIAGDQDKLSRAIADDFVELTGAGRVETKASFMTHTISDKKKLTAVDWGPEEVTVLGNVVVVQASVTETWDTDGQASITRIAYMDVYVKRGDSWLLVRSQTSSI